MANMFLGVYYNLSIWYKLSDNNKKGAKIALLGAAITIILNIIWIPVYGYTGSAYATLICYFTMMVVCYLMGKKYYPIQYNIKKFFGYTITAIVLFFIGKLASDLFAETLILYSINTFLLLFFIAVTFIVEKRYKTIFNH
jgi:O-antigen/teichoic acid export membrane protein